MIFLFKAAFTSLIFQPWSSWNQVGYPLVICYITMEHHHRNTRIFHQHHSDFPGRYVKLPGWVKETQPNRRSQASQLPTLPRIQDEMWSTLHLAAAQDHLIAVREVFAATQAPGRPRDPTRILRIFLVFDGWRLMGIWWEDDGNMVGIWWEYDGNTMGIWWEYDWNLMGIYDGNIIGIWLESDGNIPWEYDWNMIGIWWEHDGNMMGIWWDSANSSLCLMVW